MSTIVQAPSYTGDFGSNPVLPLPSAAGAGNRIILVIPNSDEPIDSVTVAGVAGSPVAALDYAVTPAGGALSRYYSYHTVDGTATGFIVNFTSGFHQCDGWVLEVAGLAVSSPVDDTGVMDGDFTDTAAIAGGVDTTEADGLVLADFIGGAIGDVISSASGFTNVGGGTAYILQHNASPGAPGNKTPGYVLSGSAALSGACVAYLPAAPVGPQVVDEPSTVRRYDGSAWRVAAVRQRAGSNWTPAPVRRIE